MVLGKETTDNLRDRRSLLTALVYPLMGPLLLGIMLAMLTGALTVDPEGLLRLPIDGAGRAPGLVAYLEERGVIVLPPPDDPMEAVRRGRVDAVLAIPEDFQARFQARETATVKVIVNFLRLPALIAVTRAVHLIEDYNREVGGRRLAELGIDAEVAAPVAIESINVVAGAHIANLFMFMVPPLIIFNIFMGGVYLSIDTTSGERERGSLEPLLINPVKRSSLVLGKFLAALLFTMMAVAVQIVAFKVMFLAGGGAANRLAANLDMVTMSGLFLLAVPLMALAVAVQIVIATVTRSFKEAQTYLGLLPLVPALPGMALVFSPLQAQTWMMAIPGFAQTLLFGQLVRNEPVAGVDILVSSAVTGAIALVLIAFATRLYEREELIFGG